MQSTQQKSPLDTTLDHPLTTDAPAGPENRPRHQTPTDGPPRVYVRETDGMEIDGVDDMTSVVTTGAAQSRKRKAENGPGASGAAKFRRIEEQQDVQRQRLETRGAITRAIIAGNVVELEKLIEAHGEMLEMAHSLSKATPLLEAVWAAISVRKIPA